MLALVSTLLISAHACGNERTANSKQHPRASIVAVQRLKHIHAALSYRTDIADLIEGVSEDMAREHVTVLSGEHVNSTQFTRESLSVDVDNGFFGAAQYVWDTMTSYGFRVSNHTYREGWGPNLISVLPGTESPEELVILGAHLDDVPEEGRAPGANDDGAGCGALLSIAQRIHQTGATFKKTLILEHYSGEEQGLEGSFEQAQQRAADGDDVVAMIQQDMTGVHLAHDDMGMAFVDPKWQTTDAVLTAYVRDVANLYSDAGLIVHDTVLSGTDCCSDHESYFEMGFPSVGVIEPRGYTGDPQYHEAGDVVDRAEYDLQQVALTARVVFAAACDMAQLNGSEVLSAQ